MKTTKEQRDEWRKLANEATEGPWESTIEGESGRVVADDPNYPSFWLISICDTSQSPKEYENAIFIAESRTAVPALLDDIDELIAEHDALVLAKQRIAELEMAMRKMIDYAQTYGEMDYGWARIAVRLLGGTKKDDPRN